MLTKHLGGVLQQKAQPSQHYQYYFTQGFLDRVCGHLEEDGLGIIKIVWRF